MVPRIVSWRANVPAASSVTSRSTSVVSFESITPHLQPPKVSEDATETGTSPVNTSTGNPNASPRPAGTNPRIDDSFLRHDTYFFKDGNVTFLVDGTLYCVHRFFFSRDSTYFSTRLAQLSTCDHEALTTVVSLGDVKREDFEALLSVFYPKDFEQHNLSYQQWKSVLHLSTCWYFASIRKLALKSMKPPTPHDRLILARTYAVAQWVLPALTALCERTEPLSLAEARQMRIEDVVLVAVVREDVRNCRITQTDTAKVMQVVQAALAGKLPRNEGNGASGTSTEGGVAKHATSFTTAALPVGAKQEDNAQTSDLKYFVASDSVGLVNDDFEKKHQRRKSAKSPSVENSEAGPSTSDIKSGVQDDREDGTGHVHSHHKQAFDSITDETPIIDVPLDIRNLNYKEWIKMAMENKVNQANSSNFALIDYSDDISLLRAPLRWDNVGHSINFHDASSALDRCVRTWTSRIDSMGTEAEKLLSYLASDGRDAEDEESTSDDSASQEILESHPRRNTNRHTDTESIRQECCPIEEQEA